MLGLQGYPASVVLLGAFVVWWVTLLVFTVIYNLFFHSLAKIPGPKIAAAIYLYQTYYSLVGGSRFYAQIKNLHELYGPLIRITPDEVHLSDANNYELMNFVGSKYRKSAFYDSFGIGYSTFSKKSAKAHRIRRAALNPFFSRKMVLQLEHIVQDKAERVLALTARAFEAGKPMNLHYAFRAVSVDVITDYAFAQCYDLLHRANLSESFFRMVQGLGPAMWIFQQWTLLQKFAMSLPPAVASAMSAPIGQAINLSAHCRRQCAAIKDAMDTGTTIFQAFLSPSEKDPDYVVPTVDELKDEAYSMSAAAADTTGSAMTVSAYKVVSDPEIYSKVRRIDKAFVPFGKGTRGCVGMQPAYCELYVTLGTLFRRFGDMKPNVLEAEDLVHDDHFAGYYPVDAIKFHVTSG